MLSPTPVSLFCALLLCLPLAIVFTFTTPPTAVTTVESGDDSAAVTPFSVNEEVANVTGVFDAPDDHVTIVLSNNINATSRNPKPILQLARNNQENPLNESATSFVPPPDIWIEVGDPKDHSLFRLAARVHPYPKPNSAPKKVAFMFLTTTPLPLAPLWELFFKATPKNLYNVYVHADPSFNYSPPFRGVFRRRVIHSNLTRRNTPTLTSAARRLIANALLHDSSNYMFALFSPSCIPLHSFNFIYKTLVKSKKSFIEILKNEPGAYNRWAARGEQAMLPEVEFEKFRIGSQFFVLTRRHARIVVRDSRLWSKFKLPCLRRSTCYPEEQYFPTLLSMVDNRGCVPATLTHVDWWGRYDGHPHTYEADEVGPELIRTLRSYRPRYGDEEMNVSDSLRSNRSDPFLFARKFSSDTLQPLMSIASDVIFKD